MQWSHSGACSVNIEVCINTAYFKMLKMKCSKEKLLAFHFSLRFYFYHQQTDQAYIFNFGSNSGLFFNNVNKPRMFLLGFHAYLMQPSMHCCRQSKRRMGNAWTWPWIREWRLINENEINSPLGNGFRTCIVKESNHSLNNKPELCSKSQTSVSIVQCCTLTGPHLSNKPESPESSTPESPWTGVAVM